MKIKPDVPEGRRVVKLSWIIETKDMSKSTVYRAIERDGFPQPFKLSGRSVGWFLDEVEDWFNNRPRGVNPCADADQYQSATYLQSRPGVREAA